MPVLAIVGEDDQQYVHDVAKIITAGMPAARLTMIPRAATWTGTCSGTIPQRTRTGARTDRTGSPLATESSGGLRQAWRKRFRLR